LPAVAVIFELFEQGLVAYAQAGEERLGSFCIIKAFFNCITCANANYCVVLINYLSF